ncbi:GNAT family N-acetyltransferase [Chitinophaga vietnamensis]|uniref:GNAT family N-acetyltransferase n=1 Tax=Chitinophaga vietnamensis TaxID=2593957 RepID=UPI0011782A30|nr:GNAT family N-acetyltransferase [Chitinophaga vietnamensis]
MQTIQIRKVESSQWRDLQTFARQTFIDAFGPLNTPENLQAYLSKSFSDEQVQAELDNPESTFLFAVADDNVIGYLKINTGNAQTELKAPEALEIERIYVHQQWQGQRVGQLLYEAAIAAAQSAQKTYVWLGVWDQNHKAIKFYERNGFIAFDSHAFQLGDERQTDIMMKKML